MQVICVCLVTDTRRIEDYRLGATYNKSQGRSSHSCVEQA